MHIIGVLSPVCYSNFVYIESNDRSDGKPKKSAEIPGIFSWVLRTERSNAT